ncbi:valine--tRNA ligase-like isoform X2 [Zootermopsis nevadensis]|uniref:valine--tRNA ligase-like isoform X2 n=1 Tax=Zootermopsis nevadensis TaxID=136037 RepID=UPI000B8E8337|nr:valine--tRNA ligase-like isoform X2 [Zootermopsis nevadensis]XP_021915820.1 valine--tRNA ligase-like isoform X2 [Zootermopsis nevadensis]
MSVKMRYYGTISKSFIFIVCNDSLLFNPVYRRFVWHIRHCSAGRGIWFSKNTNQIVKDARSDFPTAYNPKYVESNWYSWWEKHGYFVPNSADTGKSFSMVLPPPNVTGTLHLGHALTCTIQDVLARWHRMLGCSVVWIPGMDHAGIATQVVVEKKLWQEKKLTRHDIGRAKLVEEIWRWKEDKGSIITEQFRRLGLSLDWSREMFTMDPVQSAAVTEAFIRLFDADLIYRANSLVNWSCVLQSAISDIEVNFKQVIGATAIEVPGHLEPVEFGVLTDFAYKLCDRDGEIVVSTTRVETMLGDTAVAVHPLDERYKNVIGEHVWHPFREERIPIICDDFVDPNLGTGAVKITPAHDYVDFEVGKRHNLEMISVINEKGELNEKCGVFTNMKRFDARKCIMEQLDARGLLRGKRDHTMQVPFCSRSGDVVELLLKPQWFINSKEMAHQALEAVQEGDLRIDPAVFEKTWYTWLSDVRDWCVSRQLWWGHQIPVYECSSIVNLQSTLWVAARNINEAVKKAATKLNVLESDILRVRQDDDVLDTWFSSALFPFSALGWPEKTEKYYPLTLMETGHDIVFFWVARMVMLGTQLTGQLPFKNILLHGIICDAQGRKMSKSLGNVVFPEDIIAGISLEDLNRQARKNFDAGLLSRSELEKTLEGQKKMFPKGIEECGADALRFTLCSANIRSYFINFDIQQCVANRLFCNKIWQASKYTRMCLERVHTALDSDLDSSRDYLSKLDKWILSRLANMVSQVNEALSGSDLHIATSALKTFVYSEFCDFYLETTKPVLKSSDTQASVMACRTLLCCLDTALHALSPFMPFITEELYHYLPRLSGHHRSESIMVAPYPTPQQWDQWRDMHVEKEVQLVIDIIAAIRRLKTKHGIKDKPEVHIVMPSAADRQVYSEHLTVVKVLAGCRNVVVADRQSPALKNNYVAEAVGPSGCVHLISKQVMDASEQDAQACRQEENLLKELEKMTKIRSASGYKIKAPRHVQDAHLLKVQSLENELRRIRELRESLRRQVNTDS